MMGVLSAEEWVGRAINLHHVQASGTSSEAVPDEEIVVVLIVRDNEGKTMVGLRLNPKRKEVSFDRLILCARKEKHPDVAQEGVRDV